MNQNKPTIVYQVSKDDLAHYIHEINDQVRETIIKESVLNRFENVIVGSNTVCEIWGCSKTSLTSYINNKVISPINPGTGKYLFSLRDVLAIVNPKYRRN